ncbi:hypothetical protein [Nitrosospira briensis]|uniref:hypothetical protein n=1 Tax=Nitrosospira briensis TaxID=35799 RepID=UPI0012E13088|nr:hypothetical protein [Nitrosospira briensis]
MKEIDDLYSEVAMCFRVVANALEAKGVLDRGEFFSICEQHLRTLDPVKAKDAKLLKMLVTGFPLQT